MMGYLRVLILVTVCTVVAAASCARAVADGTVSIYRDKYGVPSIVAKTLPDAAYGLGYAMALDDGLVMERNFRRADGRLAEVDGESQELNDADIQALGLDTEARSEAQALSGEPAKIVTSFCRGVNRALDEQKAKLPDWITPCTPADVLALSEYVNCVFPLFNTGLYQGPIGSNEFALGPKRTADGHAIVSMDPHLPWSAPFLWYEFAIYTPEASFDGVTFPGLPVGIMGHNDRLAWAMTNNDPHIAALYRFRVSPTNANQYDFYGDWSTFQVKNLTLRVRKGSLLSDVSFPVRMTAWGPVIPGQTVALHLACPHPSVTIRQALAMMRARTAAQFRDALRLRGESLWNFVYADTQGHIGYQYNAYLAKRDASLNWDAPVSGDDPKSQWGAAIPLDDLPHAEDPVSGVLINCNSAPWLTTLGPEISSYWPSYISSYGHTSRYDRLAALLGSSAPVSIDLAMADATDTQAPDALSTVALLVAAASGGPAAPDVAAAIKTLSAWNGRADSDSRGCALYWYWLRADTACLKLAAQAESGVAWNAGENDTALGALASAVQTMHAQFGGTDIPWGRMHVIDRGTISTPVSGFSVGDTAAVVPNTGEESNGVIHCTVGSSFRMVVDLDPAGVRSWSILPFGESQDPDNPHYADQCALFGQGTYKDDFFGLANARAHAVTSVAITAP